METMRRDLKAFKKNLKFSDLTESTLAEFVAYFRDVKTLRTPRKKREITVSQHNAHDVCTQISNPIGCRIRHKT